MAETIQGCAGPTEYGIPTGKGPYTERSEIIPTANNHFLFFLIQKPPTDPTKASSISNTYSQML
jgi:hypothetical protein